MQRSTSFSFALSACSCFFWVLSSGALGCGGGSETTTQSSTGGGTGTSAGGSGGAGATGGSGGSTATGGTTGTGGVDTTPPDYDLLYGTGKVNEFTITFTPSNWALLEQDRLKNKMLPPDQQDFVYVPCTVTFNGMTWENVGIRYKGSSSFNIPGVKDSFKLDFDEYTDNQKIHGIKKMNFHNGFKDPTMVRECLSLEMYANAGVLAPRCAYARINYDLGDGNGPQYWGVFTNVEQVDKTFLTDRFTSEYNDGNLYKPDGMGSDLSVFSESAYEKKTNEKEADYTDIQSLINMLGTLNDPASVKAGLEPVMNVDEVLRFLAINTILTSWDSYPGTGHNYYLYNNPKNQKTTGQAYWEYIVWDANEAFGNFIAMGTTAYDNVSWAWDQPYAMNPKPLITKLMMVPEYKDQLGAYMKEFLADVAIFEPVAAEARADELHTLIAPSVYEDKNYLFPTSNPDLFDQGMTQDVQGGPQGVILPMKPYISGRAMFLLGSIP